MNCVSPWDSTTFDGEVIRDVIIYAHGHCFLLAVVEDSGARPSLPADEKFGLYDWRTGRRLCPMDSDGDALEKVKSFGLRQFADVMLQAWLDSETLNTGAPYDHK